MVVNILQRYWGDALRYCEAYNELITPDHNLIKTHDFELNEQYRSPILVIVRNPLDAIASYYQWQIRKMGKEDSYENWVRFAYVQADQWRHFQIKWARQAPNRCIVGYEKILEDPFKVFANIIRFQCPEHSLDPSKLKEAIGKVNPRPKGNIRQFKYFNEQEALVLFNITQL